MKKLAVFVSGGGSNFWAIQTSIKAGGIAGKVTLVVTDKPDCAGAEYARESGIDVYKYPAEDRQPADLLAALRAGNCEIVLLAGYLKMVPVEVVQAYERRLLNIHPALLPAFGGKGYYGRKVHEAVLAAGEDQSGVTVHFVDEKYDHGPTAAQVTVPVMQDDTPETLAARILEQEHRIYPEVVAVLCRGDISWGPDGAPVIALPIEIKYDNMGNRV